MNVIPLPVSAHRSGNAVTGRFQDLSRRSEIASFVPYVLKHTAPDTVGGFDHLPTDPVAVIIRLADSQRRRIGTEVLLHGLPIPFRFSVQRGGCQAPI